MREIELLVSRLTSGFLFWLEAVTYGGQHKESGVWFSSLFGKRAPGRHRARRNADTYHTPGRASSWSDEPTGLWPTIDSPVNWMTMGA
jgi:hypothetical protein